MLIYNQTCYIAQCTLQITTECWIKKYFQIPAVKKTRKPCRAGADIQRGEKQLVAVPGAYNSSPGPGTSFVWLQVGQNFPRLERHVGDPNKVVTSKGYSISYRKNQRKFDPSKKEGGENTWLSVLALDRVKRKKKRKRKGLCLL